MNSIQFAAFLNILLMLVTVKYVRSKKFVIFAYNIENNNEVSTDEKNIYAIYAISTLICYISLLLLLLFSDKYILGILYVVIVVLNNFINKDVKDVNDVEKAFKYKRSWISNAIFVLWLGFYSAIIYIF